MYHLRCLIVRWKRKSTCCLDGIIYCGRCLNELATHSVLRIRLFGQRLLSAISGRALGHQHRSATGRRTAITGKCFFDCWRVTFFKYQCVVVTEFFASWDFQHWIDIDTAIVVFDGFAIRFAWVIDEARFVTAATAIDNATVVQAEEVSVIERAFGIGPVLCDFPQNTFPLILDDACARFDDAAREYAGAVDSGGFNDIQRRRCDAGIDVGICCNYGILWRIQLTGFSNECWCADVVIVRINRPCFVIALTRSSK